jgi:hypothetical protein
VSDDHDLRSRLERIASTAGDPSEHGLERVAARRHRRLRRRRGAVATAAVLAVLAVAAPLISRGLDDDRESVTASETARPAGAPVEVPRIVEVRCEPAGIVVPVASVRPQRDGLHIRVVNLLPSPTVLEVVAADWSSGEIDVLPGVSEVRQPVPPGPVTVGCDIAGDFQQRQVDLVDPGGYYEVPQLGCDDAESTRLQNLPVAPESNNIIAAARLGLGAHLVEGDAIGALRGYPAQRLGDPTDDPVVHVVRDGKVIAFVHVRGAGGAVAAPWTTISEAEVCTAALAPADTAGTTTTSTTVPPPTPPNPPA